MMRLFRHFTKKGQSGQSLVILAIGFLALLGFVGIVTDVSVLFIRYSTLRRAIDAAAIAAAGQMRRVADDDGDALAQGEAMSVANLNLAARQFIEVYGLNPKSVVVETCRAQQVGRDGSGNPYDTAYYLDPPTNTIVNPDAKRLFNSDGTDNALANAQAIARYRELCTDDELKLVRVTAQIDAPTIFLRLLGYPTVTLTESALSQTAVIDVVLIFDVSESMLNETTYDEWDTLNPPRGVRYIPPKVSYGFIPDFDEFGNPIPENANDPWDLIPVSTQADLNDLIAPNVLVLDPRINDKTMMYEPNGSGGVQEFVDGSASGRLQPREFCQVRAYPSSSDARVAVPLEYQAEISDYVTNVYPDAHPSDPYQPTYSQKVELVGGSAYYIGFVPMYNFYGCCNDPDGDFKFGDLICQPFKAARDAAEEFLLRLDFLRGDRVGFVTFNREAHLVDPDGVAEPGDDVLGVRQQPFMIETERNFTDPTNPANNRRGAVETLRDVVGVMAEASYYGDTNNDGYWDSLIDGDGTFETPRTYENFLNDAVIGEIRKHPVANSCPFDKATLVAGYLMPHERVLPNGNPRYTALIMDTLTIPSWYSTTGAPVSESHFRNYEFKASCAGTNIGGALAGGSLMLTEEGRREGAVWIMVLLSDGAAGASNPIYTIHDESILPADPYNIGPSGKLEPLPGSGGPISGGWQAPYSNGGYGYFGLCPYGTEAHPSQLLLSASFPNCGDLQPETRHFCGDVAYPPSHNGDPPPQPELGGVSNYYSVLDNDDFTAVNSRCVDFYDVDDYARDWADWIGLADLPGSPTGGATGRVGDQLLPTIFTIGFGLNFDDGTGVDCSAAYSGNDVDRDRCMRGELGAPGDIPSLRRDRTADYLGEELLRYIADVGDNFQIDSDYWQLCMSKTDRPIPQTTRCLIDDPMLNYQNTEDRIGNYIELYTSTSPNWGVRGPCEQPIWTGTNQGDKYEPLTPRTSCGNYFAAPSGNELQVVFNQIASRMFTRLSQ